MSATQTAAPLTLEARAVIRDAGITVSDWIDHNFPDHLWRGDSCGCTYPDCIGQHHSEGEPCGCLPVLITEHPEAQPTA